MRPYKSSAFGLGWSLEAVKTRPALFGNTRHLSRALHPSPIQPVDKLHSFCPNIRMTLRSLIFSLAFCLAASSSQASELKPFEVIWRADSGMAADMSWYSFSHQEPTNRRL